MSVENPQVEPAGEAPSDPAKSLNGEQRLNGISNGHSEGVSVAPERGSSSPEKKHKSSHHHKSSSKDKHRDKERSEHKSSSSKSSHRDKEKSSSSSNHHRDGKSSSSSHHKSSRDKDRHHHKSSRDDKERPKEDKDKHREDREKGKDDKERPKEEKERSKDDKERRKDDKERSKDEKSSHSKDKPRDKTSSSSSGDKHRDKEKDKDRHHKSSSSHSSSKDKDRHSSSSKHRDKERDRHKERSDKERSDKEHRDKDRDKERERRERKEKERREREKRAKEEQMKQEETSNDQDVEEVSERDPLGMSWMDDDKMKMDAVVKIEPLEVSANSSCDYSMSQFNPNESSFQIKEEEEEESIKHEDDDEDDEEDIPLHKRKARVSDEEEDEKPLTVRKKIKTEKKKRKSYDSEEYDDDDDDEIKPKKKKIKKEKQKVKTKAEIKSEFNNSQSPTKGRKKKEEEEQEVWKWWEEEKREDGVKWNFLEHKGPVFAPPYEPLPEHVYFEYDGRKMRLSQDAEEIATFYARMLEHDYTSKKVFNDNFFKDWRKAMTSKERETITDLKKCNFRIMHAHFQKISEANKNRTKEEKLRIKEENERLIKEYGFCTIDGHKEKIGNFKIEPPGLFRGRGEHPKMGMVKKRVVANDILINCSKNSEIPKPPPGYRWKEVRHDNTVTWLASWVENVQGQVKYIMLNPSSKLKGEKDWQKYETARRLHKHIDKIRNTYRDEWKSKEMRVRQRAVALYFIDKLALRAGNEKDEDQADTVGCCSLRVEHIQLHKELNGKEYVVVFDFLGKDSIRYYNEVEVEKRVFKNLELFCENKKDGDDLFDRLNTSVLNEHLRELMEGLTAKVFRTYNASITLQNQLDLLTDPDATVPEKLLQYNRANRAVAILCNHQRAVPKSHSKSMENLKEKIRQKREAIDDCEVEVKDLQKLAKRGSTKDKLACDKKKKQLERLKEQLQKLELQETDRDENKTIALGTSKLNYLDPRISVAWCKKYNVPIEKIFNKTQRDKFRWAIDMAGEDYRF
ncbi:DNA topoisomerase I, mitochondrial isoform X2 [Lutzomyia longipalpis]|uniref:DNA topoisomerase I, mitochondrial isoform X2 n=1 Tax=Lutzomyia longipalpis TaxID=7200 RepID=UPI002483505E|nr:DNA topoisomerase I, mitochondrial isoform X2 [Lutzomyia longipalpis]